MDYFKKIALLFFTFLCVFILALSSEVNDDKKDYIVYMGSISNKNSASDEHLNMLGQVVKGRSAEETLIRSYKRSFNGFAASLTEEEYENLKGMKEVVSVFPSRTLPLQTTRSWDFLGVPEPSPQQQLAESDVIIGVFDGGIWPESPSFNDDGLGPVPKKWKGGCHGGENFTCNKKIIGAKAYTGTARDVDGHGSHTASIAAGRKVGASFYDIAKGTARGGVPSARIAVYKVCDAEEDCKGSDIMAAFDDAIADGVDLITISIGGYARKYITSTIAIGAFHAMAKGILTVQCAGNDGDMFGSSTISSVAPWILTVAASSIDRHIITKIVLGNGQTLIGNSVNSFTMEKDKYPLVYGETATNGKCSKSNTEACAKDCLDASLVKGKILVCDDTDLDPTVYDFGAIGLLDISFENVSFVPPLPSASLDNTTEFPALLSYISSTKDPMANILKSEAVNNPSAPVVAIFSSRGPNPISSDILKPDISAPGVEILAAYSPNAPVADEGHDKRSVMYSVLSGTSMACPHVAAAAAIVKSVHPDWSPSAIKSALMTTANPMIPSKNKEAGFFDYTDAEFAYGSGHINPSKATDPGLVYEAGEPDYITFLCNSGYDSRQIGAITGNNSITCTKKPDLSPNDVNYPSLSAVVNTDKSFTVKFSRTVTNVGGINATYRAKVTSDSEIQVTVKPDILTFKALNERQSFDVIVVGKGLSAKSVASASLVWSDGSHMVRSPVVVYTP